MKLLHDMRTMKSKFDTELSSNKREKEDFLVREKYKICGMQTISSQILFALERYLVIYILYLIYLPT